MNLDDVERLLRAGCTVRWVADATTWTPTAVVRAGEALGLVLTKQGTMSTPTPPAKPVLTTAGPSAARVAAGRARAAAATYPARTVRAWARRAGHDVPALGRYLPTQIVEAWRAAGGPQ